MTDLLARLRIEADASSVPPTAARVERAMDGVRNSAQRSGAAMAGSEAGAIRMAAGLDRAGDQAQRFETRTRGAAGSIALLTGALGGAAVGAFVSDISKAAFAAGGLELGLGAVTGGAENAQQELAYVRQEAGRLGLVVQTTAKDFMDLAAATNQTDLAGEKTRQIWLATAEAGMALGRSPEQVGRGLQAIQQIASKGVVSMEEVRQQLAEAIPGAVQIASRAMGLSASAFNELVEKGDLLASDFLPKFAAQLRKEYGPAIDAYLKTPLGRARVEMSETTSALNVLRAAGGEAFLSGVTDGLSRLNDQLRDGSTADRAREIGEALGEGAAVAADGLVAVIDHLDEIVLAGQVVIGVGLVRFLISTAQAAQQAAAAYIVKGGAARASALQAQQGLAAEAVSLTGVRGALVQVAAAEVAAASAARQGAAMRELAAKASYDQVRADLANVASSRTLAQRRAALAVAEGELAAARSASALAAGRVAGAEAAQIRSLTGVGQAAGAAKAGMGGLLSLVGGPWGAAFLAAGAAVWVVNEAIKNSTVDMAALAAGSEEVEARLKALEVAAVPAAGAIGSMGTESTDALSPVAALTGETNRLADATFRLAAARKDAALQEIMQDITSENRRLNNISDARRQNVSNDTMLLSAMSGGMSGFSLGDQRRNQPKVNGTGQDAALDVQEKATQDRIARLSTQYERLAMTSPTDPDTGWGGGGPVAGGGSTGGGSSGSGRGRRNQAAEMAKDLADEEAALKSHQAAVISGEAALDAWRIAQAGADAVARAGVESVRERAEAVERLSIADERIEQAAAFSRSADRDVAALQRRAVAALEGQAALENLRITEAGLEQLTVARINSLDQLAGPERQAVANAVASAEARERQAIATEKAEAAGKSVAEQEEQIAAEVRRQAVIGKGALAEADYARAEFIRQEIERAGLKITEEAAQAIRDKAAALFDLQTITDGAQAAADQERELRLMRLSNREREIANRAEAQLVILRATLLGLNEAELKAVAAKRARAEVEVEEATAAIGRMTGSLREGFIRDGKLGLDEVGDYAEERLRAALYDAFLAEPINIVVSATVDIVNDLAKQIFGGADAKGFLTQLLGGGRSSGGLDLASLAAGGDGIPAGGLSSMFGSGGGMAGLAGLSGMIPQIAAVAAIAAMGSAAAGSISGALGGNAKKGAAWGWLGLAPGLIAGLTDKADRPYARADVEVQSGKFVLAGSQAKDGGDQEGIAKAGKALADQLNLLAKTFGIDLNKVENLYTTIGQTKGGNAKALGGDGFFGGSINGIGSLDGQRDIAGLTLGRGVAFSQGADAEEITEKIIHDTILRAINAGASDLSEAEKRFVSAAESLDEAINFIHTSRGFGGQLDDMLLELLDPAAFEKKKALDAIEATYQALKTQAEQLIGAGLLTAETLDKIEKLRDLQIDQTLNGGGVGATTNPFFEAKDRLQSWLDSLAVSDVAPGGAAAQRDTALGQYQRVLAEAQAGDRTALGDLATYADRLLKADRAATGSAVQRQSLYDQVTRDVTALIGRGQSDVPLTPGAITDPIIGALAASKTALSDVLLTLPPSTAAPLVEAILRQPDWAARLLGANALVPPALAELAARVQASAPGMAGPIIEALLTTPSWTAAMTAQLALTPASMITLTAAVAGLPPSVAGPIIGALAATPVWAASAVSYLQSLPPSIELLQGLTAALPASVAAPIIAALLATPAWAASALGFLQSLPPSIGLLQGITSLLPRDISGPIVAALGETPGWASLLQAGLELVLNGVSNGLDALLDWLSKAEPEAGYGGETEVQIPEVPIPPIVLPEITIPDILIPDLHMPLPAWLPPLMVGGGRGGGNYDVVEAIENLGDVLAGQGVAGEELANLRDEVARQQLEALQGMVREQRLGRALMRQLD